MSRLDQSLYSTTFLAFGGGGQFCSRCLLADHTQEDRALNPSQAVPLVQLRDREPAGGVAGGRRGTALLSNADPSNVGSMLRVERWQVLSPPLLSFRTCVLEVWGVTTRGPAESGRQVRARDYHQHEQRLFIIAGARM